MENIPTPAGPEPGPETGPEPLHIVHTFPAGKDGVPRMFELSDGSFAFIGTDTTEAHTPMLPPDAGVADYERVVTVSKSVMLRSVWRLLKLQWQHRNQPRK